MKVNFSSMHARAFNANGTEKESPKQVFQEADNHCIITVESAAALISDSRLFSFVDVNQRRSRQTATIKVSQHRSYDSLESGIRGHLKNGPVPAIKFVVTGIYKAERDQINK
jgi:hypothetical protein